MACTRFAIQIMPSLAEKRGRERKAMKLYLLSCILLFVLPVLNAQGVAEDVLNFLVLGDWGGKPEYPYTTEAETRIASIMGKVAGDTNSQFILALGDNFYDTGVKDVYDHRFKYTFEVYYFR